MPGHPRRFSVSLRKSETKGEGQPEATMTFSECTCLSRKDLRLCLGSQSHCRKLHSCVPQPHIPAKPRWKASRCVMTVMRGERKSRGGVSSHLDNVSLWLSSVGSEKQKVSASRSGSGLGLPFRCAWILLRPCPHLLRKLLSRLRSVASSILYFECSARFLQELLRVCELLVLVHLWSCGSLQRSIRLS